MIIVEGPDGSGKSNLVSKLARDLNLPVSPKVVGSDTRPLVDLAEWTESNVNKGFQAMIFDRHRLISEPIYGPATRARQDSNFCDLGWMTDLMWRFYQANPLVIYCLPDLHTVRKNVLDPSTDNEAVAKRITAIYAGYVARAAMDLSRGCARLYNYETTRYEEILYFVRNHIQKQLTTVTFYEGSTNDHAVRPFIPRPSGSAVAAVRRGREHQSAGDRPE